MTNCEAEQTTRDVDGIRLIAKGIEVQSDQRAVEAALRWAWTKYVVDEPRKAIENAARTNA